jgi:hypothetical protein
VELAGLIGTHIGLKPGKDLTCPIIQHFSNSPHSLLILDNLETVWEPSESRANTEEFLSLLTGVEHLTLVVSSQVFFDLFLSLITIRLQCEEQKGLLK